MKRKRKILVPIVNRTNYSKLRPVLSYLRMKNGIEVCLALSSGILVSKVGSGLQDVLSDEVGDTARIDCLLMNDSPEGMVKTAGLSMVEHATLYSREKPDAVLVVGDRFDMVPAVLAAKMMNIRIFHMQGGERSGSIDDTIRDLISVCADVHYVATDCAAEEVRNITKSSDVFNFGCPAVEFVSSVEVGDYLNISSFHKTKSFKSNFGINKGEDYFLLMVHPDTTNEDDVDMESLLDAVLSFGLKCIAIYPNVDAFNHHIVDAIRHHADQLICVKHMPLEDFVSVMAHSRCLIGNSSAGIREAASFGVPVINVGNRQKYRERNVNTIDCECTVESVKAAIKKSMDQGRYEMSNIYFKEGCCKNICEDLLCRL